MRTERVKKIRQVFDESKQVWFDVYQAQGIEGCAIEAEVKREDRTYSSVRRGLLSKGAEASAVSDADLAAAIGSSSAPVFHRAEQTGWREEQTFVSHRFVAARSGASNVLSPNIASGTTGRLESCGTLEDWRQLVSIARHSTAMTLALCAAFAAPLLKLLSRSSFALMLFGPSKAGKSAAQLVGASAMGFGRENDLPALNATQPGLLATALAFNDHMLPINEAASARGPKSQVYVPLRDSTYALMNGQDVLRHPSWSGASNSAESTFQVICLFSSEISPDAWAARNGEARDEGEMARMIGLPVVVSGRSTIFDKAPLSLRGSELARWEKEQFRILAEGLPEQRGVAFRKFMELLVLDAEAHKLRARTLVDLFYAKAANPRMNQVELDIVAKFGVLAAGGILAIEANILPIDKRTLSIALRRACSAALAELPKLADELQSDLSHLVKKLKGGSILDVETSSKKQLQLIRQADGFHKPEHNGKLFVVRAQVFAEWFSNLLRTRRVLEWLDDEGFLQHTRVRRLGRSNAWAVKQVSWPDKTRVRSISIFLPNGLADLES